MKRILPFVVIAAIAGAGACESDLGFRPPERPERVSAAGNPRAITVRFQPAEDATGYVLRWTTGAEASVHRVACDAPPCVIEDLSPDVVHFVTVSTRDRSGESDPSAIVSARTLRGDEFLLRRGWHYTAESTGLHLVGPGDMDGDGDGELVIGEAVPGDIEDKGQLLVFRGDRLGPQDQPDLVLAGPPNTLLGGSLAAIGDVNEDGFADLVAGSPGTDGNPGRVLLYRGGISGLNPLPAWTGSTLQANAKSGAAVAAGDVTGDGFPDILSSATAWTGDSGTTGRIDLFVGPGPSSGALYPPAVTLTSGEFAGGFGSAITVVDIDHDGFGDVAISIPAYDGAETATGRVVVHRWDPVAVAFEATPSATFTGMGSYALLGLTLATAGDTDGDGFEELLFGAPGEIDVFAGAGVAYLYEAGAGALDTTPQWTGTGSVEAAGYGTSVAGTGDLNADGFDDIVVGEPNGGPTGVIHVRFGSPEGLTREEAIEGTSVGSGFGAIVARAGDVNGDGFPDIACADNGGNVEVIYGGRPVSSPVVDAGPLLVGTAGAIVRTTSSSFIDEVDGVAWTCTWTWGDGATDVKSDCMPGESAAEHTFTAAGAYDIRLQVEAADGRLGEAATRAVIR